MHSKMVVVDDKVVLSGSNNFSSAGVVTNEENSVVLHGTSQKPRIKAYSCQFDRMFEVGVEPAEAQRPDRDPVRVKAVKAIDACETEDQLFPPAGLLTDKTSHAFDALEASIDGAGATVDVAPDILAHPGIVKALARRAREAKEAGAKVRVRLVLDASEDTLRLPAFGECVSALAERDGTDLQVRYWHGNGDIFQMLHHKFMVVDAGTDDAVLWNGSANYSAKALKFSFENVARYAAADHGDVVDAFAVRFDKIWAQARTKKQLAADDHLEVPACPMELSEL
jgi:phosphatidylserine/phosphatidylglycerophosphate/cardiolipin synthase-like enzyme